MAKPTGYCWNKNYHGNETRFKAIISGYGPASVVVDPQHKHFAYLKGKWNQPCSKDGHINYSHALLAVGWDENYYFLKNSWGKGWGENGYLYLNIKYAQNCWIYYGAGVPFFK